MMKAVFVLLALLGLSKAHPPYLYPVTNTIYQVPPIIHYQPFVPQPHPHPYPQPYPQPHPKPHPKPQPQPQPQPQPKAEPEAKILRNDFDLDNSQGFEYAYETSNGISHAVVGDVKKPSSSNQESLAVEGQYAYMGNDGKMYTVHYTADENGFQPSGDHLHGANTKKKLGIPSAALASLAGGGLG